MGLFSFKLGYPFIVFVNDDHESIRGCLDLHFESDYVNLNKQNRISNCNIRGCRRWCLDMLLLFEVLIIKSLII